MAFPLFHEAGPARRPDTLTPERFRRAFPREGQHVEWGRILTPEHLHENITAFSNSAGGVIVLGVRRDGALVGFEATDEVIARIHEIVAEIRDPARYDIYPLTVEDTPLTVIAVGQRRAGLTHTPDGRVLVRQDSSNAVMRGPRLDHFVAARTVTRTEATAVGPTLADADPRALDALRAAHGWTSGDLHAQLHDAGLLTEPLPDARLTLAGGLVLLPDPAGTLRVGGVEVVRFDDDGAPREPVHHTGPAHEQVEESARAVMVALGTDSVTVREQPHELPRIPEPAVHEAIANAVIHRSYAPGSGAVRVEIHADRVVVRSPGSLPVPVTPENVRHQSTPRNPALAESLLRLGVTEPKGRGAGVMADAMASHLLADPVLTDDDGHVTVELSAATDAIPQERAWVAEMSENAAATERGPLDRTDRTILLYGMRGHILTNAKVRDWTGVDIPTARLALHGLRDRGLLQQSGLQGGAAYVLTEGLAPLAGPRLAYRQLQKVVLQLALRGGVTNEMIRERSGLTRRETEKLLHGMVAAGRLVRRGSRRGTYYTAA